MLPKIANDQETMDKMANDQAFLEMRRSLNEYFIKYKYSYNFTWLGRPIIQHPDDIVALQEIIHAVRPDLIIETGIAHGGSLILHASILELLGEGEVLGIDIEIKPHNRVEIEKHPLKKRITLLEASSTSEMATKRAAEMTQGKKRVMVILDSNHTHQHVLEELRRYSGFVTTGSYLVVCDTAIEYCLEANWKNRPWGKGNNPKSALDEFKKTNTRFEVDENLEKTLFFSANPGGYLKCVRS